ncbi:diguanylate cyclase (GGDEF) domain-containing protein [Ruminococcus sp. YE71]|uniref:GGDEF domain-containing protein n=1 Tax=unclassified Ruminococcus TaxID=2608920 RepID=UPI00088A8E56|nr:MULTISPECIES: GGDEF domain-containing protein [unclassified Ruminococcus]SDA11231.1 diguanylate cyclase (GGDEF) domain-containing protein [Ruminococcus sp. YE78]SFW14958.1 diguanylate cyclase (GGDEF) domain-containing protein [Ruminococcus sp. YE71]
MNESNKNISLIGNLTLFFGVFLLFTDVFFLIMGIIYDMPVIRYVIYVKLVINTTNIFLILKKRYLISTMIIYTVILGFMITGVVCMGIKPAFQLYAVGMLPCISYFGYLHKRMLKTELTFMPLIAVHVACYIAVYVYARFHEPIYEVPQSAIDIHIIFNSVATFSIVIMFVYLFHNIAISSEEKLERMALRDNLTGLYNRHYLLSVLDLMQTESSESTENEWSTENTEGRWIALLDIDDFKKVNDTYGHNCGDYILHEIAILAQKTCKGCIVCRWGGEEFIILSTQKNSGTEILETLRKKIADEKFRFGGCEMRITVTVGVSLYDENQTNDIWISKADEKLYFGKSNGKNQVVV